MGHFLELKPTPDQTFRIIGHGSRGDLVRTLALSHEAEEQHDYERGCNIRYHAFQHIVELLPEDEPTPLDRNHPNTLAAMEIVLGSGVDNFLAGDAELAAAQFELLLDCDSEDALGCTPMLALCYVALGEWDSLEDMMLDVDEKSALKPLLRAILTYAAEGDIDPATLAALARHREFCEELLLAEHPTDERYVQDISSERPSRQALARELYLRCEPALVHHAELLSVLREHLRK